MGVQVDWDDVIGTDGVRQILGLARGSSVAVYRKRHPDFPAPRKLLSPRCPVWSKRDVEAWQRDRTVRRVMGEQRDVLDRLADT